MAALVPIANLRGPRGFQGVQGLPGVNATPADEAVAGYISTPGASATQAAADVRYGATMHAPAHGVVGDGLVDDAPALQALMVTAATFGASVTLEAGSTLLIQSYIEPPSGTRLYGNGATIKKGASLTGVAFRMYWAENIIFEGFRLDGQRSLFASSEHQHGFYIMAESKNITLRDVEVFNCNGDGIYVGDQTNGASRNITLENVHSHGNNRQGMSVSHVSGLEAHNCIFESTTGTNPQAGVDIEPNADNVVCEDLKFVSCRFLGSAHFGFLVSLRAAPTARQGGIGLIDCTIKGNGDSSSAAGGLNLRAARDFTMLGGSIIGNLGPGVLIDWTTVSRGVKFIGVTIADNQRHGLQVTSGFDDLEMIGCTIRDNGYGNANAYPGVLFNPAIASTNLRFIGNTSEGVTQRYGVQTNASVSKAMFVANTYRDNATGSRTLADDATTRLDLDTAVKPVVTGSRGGNAALASLIAAQVSRGLITDSTTA